MKLFLILPLALLFQCSPEPASPHDLAVQWAGGLGYMVLGAACGPFMDSSMCEVRIQERAEAITLICRKDGCYRWASARN